jgi:hypothetical protein
MATVLLLRCAVCQKSSSVHLGNIFPQLRVRQHNQLSEGFSADAEV